MYHQGLECGIRPEQFWSYSIPEVADIIESYRKKEDARYKADISLTFLMADVVANRLGQLFPGSKMEQIMPWDCYPKLFADEKKRYEDSAREVEYENYKARRMAAMQKFNRSRR